MRRFYEVHSVHPVHFVFLALWAVLVGFGARPAAAQTRYDFYRYPYRYSAEIDPLGLILGRVSGGFEMRDDPSVSNVFSVVWHRDLHKKGADSIRYGLPAFGVGVDHRIYLVDNAAVVGPYASLGAGLELAGSKYIVLRFTAHIGLKYLFGDSKFFISPEILFDTYAIRGPASNVVFPYLAVPFGIVW